MKYGDPKVIELRVVFTPGFGRWRIRRWRSWSNGESGWENRDMPRSWQAREPFGVGDVIRWGAYPAGDES